MQCFALLALAAGLTPGAGPAVTPMPAGSAPAPSLPAAATVAPLSPPAPAAPVAGAAPAAPAPTSGEQLTTFDGGRAMLDWSGGDWRIVAGGVTVRDFGRDDAEARQVLRVVRELRLNEHGVVGSGGRPVLEYWLSDGKPPQQPASGMRPLSIDTATVRVEAGQDRWVLRDDRRVLFGFAAESDAQAALAVVRKYGFTGVGAVGTGAPAMIVFFAAPGPNDAAGPRVIAPTGDPAAVARPLNPAAPGSQGTGKPVGDALSPPAVAPLRDFGHSDAAFSFNPTDGSRTPFDWRQAQLRHDNGSWQLAAGSLVLADFGADGQAARQAWSVMQYYRFTERREAGDAAGRFTYFLTAGQAPQGVMFGVDSTPLPTERLEVRQVAGRWSLCAGDQSLLQTGGSEEAAREVLDLIRRQKCDRLCRVGGEGGVAFLARSR